VRAKPSLPVIKSLGLASLAAIFGKRGAVKYRANALKKDAFMSECTNIQFPMHGYSIADVQILNSRCTNQMFRMR
jgi:hypothetical protein